MNSETDPLARWWWPGQWLHIVYGVWIDQLWYWQNVRPKLHGRKQGREISIQSLLGAMLVALFLSAVIGGTLAVMRAQINWNLVIRNEVVGVFLIVVLGGGIILATSADKAVVYGSTVVVPFVVVLITMYYLGMAGNVDRNIMAVAVIEAIIGMEIGLSANVFRGVTTGDANPIWSAVFWGLIAGTMVEGMVNGGKSLWWFIVTFVVSATVSTLACGTGFYVGEHWVARQVPNAELR